LSAASSMEMTHAATIGRTSRALRMACSSSFRGRQAGGKTPTPGKAAMLGSVHLLPNYPDLPFGPNGHGPFVPSQPWRTVNEGLTGPVHSRHAPSQFESPFHA
jgi:hypothetical protein